MRRLVVPLGLASVLWAAPAVAEAAPSPEKVEVKKKTKGNFGVGLYVPNPLALSLKLFVKQRHGLQFMVGYGWQHSPEGTQFKDGTYRGSFDYLFHPGAIASNNVMDLLPYFGVGAGAGFYIVRLSPPEGGDPSPRARPLVFLRLPVAGLTFHWQRVPMDLYVEASWTPSLVWTPAPQSSIAHVDYAVGARYFF